MTTQQSNKPGVDYRQGATGRLQSFLNDIRGQLANGEWKALRIGEFSMVHTIANGVFPLLIELKCIERRKSPTDKKKTEYRRLPGLAQITVSTLHDVKRKSEVARNKAYKLAAKGNASPALQSPTASVSSPIAEVQANDQFIALHLSDSGQLVSYTKHTNYDTAFDQLQHVAQGNRLAILKVVEVLTPIIEFKKSATL